MSADEPPFTPRRCECGQYPDVCARYGHAGGYEPGEAIEPPFNSLSKDSERAVDVVFQACKVTGASLVTCHRVASMVAEELERIEASHVDP